MRHLNRKWPHKVGPFSCLLTGLLAAALTANARAQEPALPLPQLQACRDTSHPRLPEKWQATYLMAPFTQAQLVIGHVVHDESVGATRITLHGVRRGSLDLLLHGDKTFELTSTGSDVTCRDLGNTGWRPLPRDWLTPGSQCTGSAAVGGIDVDWWKTPVEPAPSAYWIWSKAADRTPFRIVFAAPGNRLAIFSQHALSHQVSFDALPETNLAAIVRSCDAAKPTKKQGGDALRERLAHMSRARGRADAALKRLVPALAACPKTPLPPWPARLALTGLMTPFDAEENPYPTEVLYDWSIQAQRTRIFFPPGSATSMQDALLLGPRGYTLTYRRQQGPTCAPVLPGTIRPDWAARAPCDCQATIEAGTSLTPDDPIRIMVCPLNKPRVAWAWYTPQGRPRLFMVTSMPGDEGTGQFAVLDYWDWRPGHPASGLAFARPAQCESQTGHTTGSGRPTAALAPCATCHLGRPETKRN
jgi:hypothetical protein